jgi:hypothetical protein
MEGTATPRARVICTLGMHRSGTSLVSRILNLLGVHLGPDPAVTAVGSDNVKGFWEHLFIARINDEILSRFGGRWEHPPTLPADWANDPRLSDLEERARAMVAADFGEAPLWGWKDPRTSVTLAFWQKLIGPMRYVICVRNPAAVVASLARRNHFAVDQADWLWLAYNQSLLAQTTGQPRLVVFYEDLVDDVLPTLRRLAAFIGHAERADDPHVQQAVSEFRERELCHHRMSAEDLVDDHGISYETKGLYLAIKGLGLLDAPREQRTLDRLGARALESRHARSVLATERETLARARDAQAASIGALTVERDALAQEHHAQTQTIGALTAERETRAHEHALAIGAVTAERDALSRERAAQAETIDALTTARDALTTARDTLTAARDALTIERDALATERDALATERDALATERDALVRDRRAQAETIGELTIERDERAVREQRLLQSIANLEDALRSARTDREREAADRRAAQRFLDEIQGSGAWRIVTFGRRVIGYLLPDGTKRRRAFTSMLQKVSRRLPSRRADSNVVNLRAA